MISCELITEKLHTRKKWDSIGFNNGIRRQHRPTPEPSLDGAGNKAENVTNQPKQNNQYATLGCTLLLVSGTIPFTTPRT